MPRCKECKDKFVVKYFLQKYCMIKEGCISAFLTSKREKEKIAQAKKWRKEKAEIKERNKTRGDYVKDLQKVVNEFIRLRDKNEPCISCDALPGTYKADAGHFYPTTYGNLRFNEDNIHGQCSFNCNKSKHGNIGEYRPRLIKKIGLKRVEWLDDNRHKIAALSINELKKLKITYKDKIKKLKN